MSRTFVEPRGEPLAEFRMGADGIVRFVSKRDGLQNAYVVRESDGVPIYGAPPTLSITATDATKDEGNSGTTAFTFTVTRAGDLSRATTVQWAVTGTGGNPANAADFGGTLPSGSLTFAAYETSKVITVNVTGDTDVETTEGFTVTLSNPSNANITVATAAGVITNDDEAPLSSGWIQAARINEHGWFMEVDFADTYQAGTWDISKLSLVVTDMGFDATGAATTRERTLKVTRVMRKAYANHTQDAETIGGGLSTWRLSLDQQVFSKAKAGAGNSGTNPVLTAAEGFYADGGSDAPAAIVTVTNNSIEAYPKPVFRNALPPHRRLGATGVFEVTGNSAWVTGGRTFAAAKVTLTGGTSGATATSTVSSMVKSTTFAQRTNASVVAQASVSLAPFTQGETLTERWEVYPWIGDDDAVLDSADGTYLSGQFCNYTHLCDKDGTYATVYAVVNATTGNDTTGAASTVSEAAAAATPFATDKKAMQVALALNVSANSRNNGSGIVVCFSDEDHTLQLQKNEFAQFDCEDIATGPTWTVYRPVTGHAGNCRFLRKTSNFASFPRRTEIRDIKLVADHAAGTASHFDGEEANDGSFGNEIWRNNSPIVDSGSGASPIVLRKMGMQFITNTAEATTTQYAYGFGNERSEIMLVRDCDFAAGSNAYPSAWCWVGVHFANPASTRTVVLTAPASTNAILPMDGIVWSGVSIFSDRNDGSSQMVAFGGSQNFTVGIAWLNVMLMAYDNGGTASTIRLSADGENFNARNFFADYVSVPSGRINVGYEDTFTMTGGAEEQLKRLLMFRRSVLFTANTKVDTFGAEGARVHTWNVAHRVGWEYVRFLSNSGDGSSGPGTGSWFGEAWPATLSNLGSSTGVFTNDQSGDSGSGSGDWTPAASSPIAGLIPAGQEACPFDIIGTARDGSIGAYENP